MAKQKKCLQRSDVFRTPEFVQLVQDIVNDDASKCTRAIDTQLEVAESIIRLVVHEDLRYQFLSQETKRNHVTRSKRLLNKLKLPDEPDMLWFFFLTRTLTMTKRPTGGMTDTSMYPNEVPMVLRTKFSSPVMVLAVVSSEGDVMLPRSFQQDFWVNSKAYVETQAL